MKWALQERDVSQVDHVLRGSLLWRRSDLDGGGPAVVRGGSGLACLAGHVERRFAWSVGSRVAECTPYLRSRLCLFNRSVNGAGTLLRLQRGVLTRGL